jgi:hypothetical protein
MKRMIGIHNSISTNHTGFASTLSQISDELGTACKDTERSRRQLKEASERHERHLASAELALEKCRAKYDSATEAWDRSRQALHQGNEQSFSSSNSNLINSSHGVRGFFGKTPEKDEENARHRAARANEAYNAQLVLTVNARAQFQNTHLPGLLNALYEVNDECDVALQYHLSKYALHYEQSLISDVHSLCPTLNQESTGENISSLTADVVGIRQVFERMDHSKDLQDVITVALSKSGPPVAKGDSAVQLSDVRRNTASSPGPATLTSISLLGAPQAPVFGVSLTELADRDDTDVPKIVLQLTALIEEVGLETVGLYRASGSASTVHRLRSLCDHST